MENRNAAIIVIGDEILLGRVTDTNSGFIARHLDAEGYKTVSVSTVGDKPDDIRSAIETAFEHAKLIFTTGGLGPTKDDITKQVLTEIFGGEPVRNEEVIQNIQKVFAGRGLKLNELTLNQAIVPSSADIIQNIYGTAPIMVFRKDGKTLVSMPGVPYEMEGMLPSVMEYLKATESVNHEIKHATRIITGISESALAMRLTDFEDNLPRQYKLAYLPDSPVIKLRLDCFGEDKDFEDYIALLDKNLAAIENLCVLGEGEKTLAQIVVETLETKGLTLSTAESCTGGNIAHEITSVAGSSAVFNGSVVSYANSAKINVLDVGKDTIDENGAVSRPVVLQMAEGVARVMQTDCAISTSGIAGPTGGTSEKPVGTVWIAVKTPQKIIAKCHFLPGKRQHVIRRATAYALIMLLQQLKD